jgi:hypothetical protein
MTTSALANDTAIALLRDLVRHGEQQRHIALGEELEAYLVFALLRHLRDGELLHRIMATDWLLASEPAPLRSDALRDVGDRCLLVSGWFPQQAERRRVTRGYFMQIGRTAYASAAEHAKRAEARLYRQLVEAFGALAEVLAASRVEAPALALADSAPRTPPRHLH